MGQDKMSKSMEGKSNQSKARQGKARQEIAITVRESLDQMS
jgi:hypothetical protein